jgi:hypothetical protein
MQEFNQERPHEALDMKCPAEVYTASTRLYRGLPDVTYPLHDRDITVTACANVCSHLVCAKLWPNLWPENDPRVQSGAEACWLSSRA